MFHRSLNDGIVKLEETGRIVKGLKQELTELQPLLESKASQAEGFLAQVSLSKLSEDLLSLLNAKKSRKESWLGRCKGRSKGRLEGRKSFPPVVDLGLFEFYVSTKWSSNPSPPRLTFLH